MLQQMKNILFVFIVAIQ